MSRSLSQEDRQLEQSEAVGRDQQAVEPTTSNFSTPSRQIDLDDRPSESPSQSTVSSSSSSTSSPHDKHTQKWAARNPALPSPLRNQHPNQSPQTTTDSSLSSSSSAASPALDSSAKPDQSSLGTTHSSARAAKPTSLPSSSVPYTAASSPLKSPCFVHEYLNQSATLSDFLQRPTPRSSENTKEKDSLKEHVQQGLHRTKSQIRLERGEAGEDATIALADDDEDGSEENERDGVESLTKQLAETAVGVREMSKQLGRTRVRSNIQNILIVTKARDNRLIKLTRQLAMFLMLKPRGNGSLGEVRRGHTVYVDAQLRTSKRFDAAGMERDYPELFAPLGRRRSSSSASINTMNGSVYSEGSGSVSPGEGQLRYWTSDMCSKSPHLFDFVVTLGGDGTVLFTSWLFQKIVPPVLPFALGSLGFLTNFDFANYESVMNSAIDKGIRVNLRMRFTCTVYRAITPEASGKGLKAVRKSGGEILMSELGKSGWEALEDGNQPPVQGKGRKDKEVICFSTRPVETFEVLNDLVVDRGPSPFVSMLELFGDEHHMTTVQADGLTVSTPTGSTAYSLSAGGSLVHPEIPAICITPICPHTLSFRPMLLPDSMELRICVPHNSRSTAWASFDGRGRVELKQGDHIKVVASKYPFPTICADKQSTDWFNAIQRTLRWNDREKQKSFVIVEEPRAPKPLRPPQDAVSNSPASDAIKSPEDPEIDLDDEDEKFDIDDSSTVNASIASFSGSSDQKSTTDASAAPLSPSSSNDDWTEPPDPHSGVSTPGRYAGSRSHPPTLNARHIIGALAKIPQYQSQSLSSRPTSTSHHIPPVEPMLRSKFTTPANLRLTPTDGSRASNKPQPASPSLAERENSVAAGSRDKSTVDQSATSSLPAEAQTPKPTDRFRKPHPPPHYSHQQRLQSSRGSQSGSSRSNRQRDTAEGTLNANEMSRAFAFFGQDESDSGMSESDNE
ncbi:atp-nad kinase [Phaffia rhodozyma]|uniref:Atp-nad kinase n=1 Tax=Phaffia rhodozyma TaxID=264483 RepID=A0A0F7SIB7_PHARH|nr:atp-nad kinase [Phaffia rhodozyma]